MQPLNSKCLFERKSIPAESTSKFDPDYAFAMRRREGKKSFEKGLLHYSKKKVLNFSTCNFQIKGLSCFLDFIKKVSCLEKTQFLYLYHDTT